MHGTAAARPAIGSAPHGLVWVATDTGEMSVADHKARTWRTVKGANSLIETFEVVGNVSVAAGVKRFIFPVAGTLLGVSAAIGTAPVTTPVTIDVNKNGTTVFTTQGNRPSILAAANATAAEVTNMEITAFAAGDYLTVDVDVIGTGTVGANLCVVVRYRLTAV